MCAVPVAAYQWLVCFLLNKSQWRLEQQKAAGLDDFDARNNSQVQTSLEDPERFSLSSGRISVDVVDDLGWN